MGSGEETYEFIGKLAIALYPHGIRIHLPTLQKMLQDRGAYDGRGVRQVVATASEYWEHKDPVIYYAIVHSFSGQHDASLLDQEISTVSP